ncbi:coniferyl-aldehyde dehydrogenase [Hasllibacter halocynthiae]|uniref:Aldehyde dehydrogenase n=1 Tax=Hasllibacter halocynthiae TaxID=595589 RepID=A0A2T0X2A7_9RHOB|nr:aldehyde dehydrogenase family protein [Hasllibacter halocynthiae]PRY93082.1 coniferyl-aldehyde dehydrogenase [Hasllibacter halocynthiae]
MADGAPIPHPVREAHDRLARAFDLGAVPSVRERIARLDALMDVLRARTDEIARTVASDFQGHRAEVETLTSEVGFTLDAIRHLKRVLPRWARTRRRRVVRPVPGRTEIWREPKGVVAVLSPWNYPLQLALVPLATAVAAGNRVILKPSERSPATSELLADMLGEVFPPDEVAVVTGGPDVAAAVCDLPLGHIFFTGSTEIGRKVAAAAARHLTPVTLELGGKSPAIAMPGADPVREAAPIAWGKWFSAGQTCVAPDFLLVPEGTAPAWADALLGQAGRFLGGAGDYTAMIDARAGDRIRSMLDEARGAGADVRALDAEAPHVAPAVVLRPPEGIALMREEIFGPVLPILEYGSEEDILRRQRDEAPLAAYAFGPDRGASAALLRRIRSGGAATGLPVIHLAAHDLPFGGIGTSGMGAYHGTSGLEAFTHERSVMHVARGPWMRMLAPPHPPFMQRIIRRMAR